MQADIAAFLAGSEDRELLRRLHAGSSSQGGARPKSTLIGEDGELFIAKFPAETDRYDVQACEAVALSAARAAGLPTPDFQLERFDSDRCVLVLRRFDRTAAGRLGYQSMKTACLLSPYEEFTYKTAISTARYLSGRHSALNVVGAAALAICMHNIDDHAKNFGFVRRNSTWELAPVFDVVPFPLDESGTPLDSSRMPRTLEHLLGIDWGIPKPDVLKVVSRVAHACWHAWDQAPSSFGLDESEANRVKRFIRSACDFSAVLTGGEPKF
ncbi:MAG: HipA domain-containing protein [Buchananella hordeovulneris]|nr:HipA domain-containing protein [Buchananella hordeovulneris]